MFRPLIVNRGLMLMAGEDVHWHWLLARHRFCQCVGHLVETPRNVVELEAIKLVLQLANFLAICSHLGVMAARLLHDLVDDQLGVALDIEASDIELDGNV